MIVFDIFSGVGGFTIGLERAGMQTVAFCENDANCVKVLNKRWPDTPVYDDVTNITKDNVPYFDLICGGFPCQDISIAGKNAGLDGERTGLWREYLRIINDVRPKYALLENVDALLGRGLNIILHNLAGIGYDATWTTIDAQYFGSPQRRRRVFILAVRDGLPADADIFRFKQRSDPTCHARAKFNTQSRPWHFAAREGEREAFAYFTRQRSDEFKSIGVAGTLTKRDYKSYTDLIVSGNNVRRLGIDERMRLQGINSDHLAVEGLTRIDKYKMNAMNVHCVQWLGEQIVAYDTQLGSK